MTHQNFARERPKTSRVWGTPGGIGALVAIALSLVLVMTSCARASIEEMGRNAIRQEAAEGKDWFIRFTAATDTGNRDLVVSRLGDLNEPPLVVRFLGRATDGQMKSSSPRR